MASANVVSARMNMRRFEPSLGIRKISLEQRWGMQKYQLSLSWGMPVIVSITVITFLFIVSNALAS